MAVRAWEGRKRGLNYLCCYGTTACTSLPTTIPSTGAAPAAHARQPPYGIGEGPVKYSTAADLGGEGGREGGEGCT